MALAAPNMTPPRSGLPPELWSRIGAISASMCFQRCTEGYCHQHSLGWCLESQFVEEGRRTSITLSCLNRGFRALFTPSVFRVLSISLDYRSLEWYKSSRKLLYELSGQPVDSDRAKIKTIMRSMEKSRARLEGLELRGLLSHVHVLYIGNFDDWNVSDGSPLAFHWTMRDLLSVMRDWVPSVEGAISQCSSTQAIHIRDSVISPATMSAIANMQCLETIAAFGCKSQPTVIGLDVKHRSAIRSFELWDPFEMSKQHPWSQATVVLWNDVLFSSRERLTSIELVFRPNSATDWDVITAQVPAFSFPSLTKLSLRLFLNTEMHPDFYGRLENLLSSHPLIEVFDFFPTFNEHHRTLQIQWLCAQFMRHPVLPNLVEFTGPPEVYNAAVGRPRLRTWCPILVGLPDVSSVQFSSIIQSRLDTLLHLDLSAVTAGLWERLEEEGHLDAQLDTILSAFPPNLQLLTWRTEVFGRSWDQDHAFWMLLRAAFMRNILYMKRLRRIDIYIRSLEHECTPHRHFNRGDDEWCECHHPTVHPVALEDGVSLLERRHPSLERVRIISPGEWYWSPTYGWEYNL